jgi:hypothetical protein
VVRRSRRAIGLLSFSRLRSAQNLAPPFPHPPRLCRKPLSGVSQRQPGECRFLSLS